MCQGQQKCHTYKHASATKFQLQENICFNLILKYKSINIANTTVFIFLNEMLRV